MVSSNRLNAVKMVTKITLGGFVLLAIGLLIVIVQVLT